MATTCHQDTIKVLYVDSDPLASAALEGVLASAGTFDMMKVGVEKEAVTLACIDRRPDVVLVELFLGVARSDGIELAAALRDAAPGTPVIICTASEATEDAARAWAAGVRSFVTKRQLLDQPEDIPALMRAILSGAVIYGIEPRSAPTSAANVLSSREIEVLRRKLNGATHRRIADDLYLSVRTIDSHLFNVRSKLGAASVAEALRIAVDHGLVPHVAEKDLGDAKMA